MNSLFMFCNWEENLIIAQCCQNCSQLFIRFEAPPKNAKKSLGTNQAFLGVKVLKGMGNFQQNSPVRFHYIINQY